MKLRHDLTAIACAGVLLATSLPAAADPPPPVPNPPIQSPALLAGGVVLAVAGGAAVALGAVRITASELCPGACSNPGRNEAIGGVVLGVGAAMMAGGIVMAVLGSRRVPVLPKAAGAPGGAGWVWRF